MILPQIGTEAKKNGINDTNQFGFNLDAHSFELLSKSLYSNPCLALVREMTTNAIDSLKESGNERRGYEVHLPNTLEPFWSIRDRGLGIPKEKIVDLFTFNKSSKSNSNCYNGMFGLGSKSWLAVSDSSTWTSYYNGKKYSYFVFKDKGIPTYTLIDESQTDEENGVEIKVPIAKHQHYTLIDTYKKFCRHVEIQPTITGYDPVQWNADLKAYTDSCIHLGDNCMFDTAEQRNAKLTVVFGSVSYPVNRTIAGFSYRHNAIMKIPTGSVDIVPSREELRMTQKTIDYIDTLAKRFHTQVQKRIDEVYKNEGFISACKYVNTIFTGNSPKINGKDQHIKLKLSQMARFDFNNKFKYVIPTSETMIDVHTKVVLNFEESLTRLKPRLRYLCQSSKNPRNTVVIISDVEEAKKYCEYFEVDMATLTHLKDVEPPKEVKNGHIKNDRFTGIRIVSRGTTTLRCEDVDMSEINTMFFVYRNGSKLFADSEYTQEIEIIQEIIKCEPWNKEPIYTLTARQYKECKEYGIELINLMDHIREKYNQAEFDEQVRRDILSANYIITRNLPAEIQAKILPPQFRSLVPVDAVKGGTAVALKNIYTQLDYGNEIVTKHESAMKSFLNSDVGRLAHTICNHYNAPSKGFISKFMTLVANDPELMNS